MKKRYNVYHKCKLVTLFSHLQVSHLHVDNFKSLVDFSLPLSNFPCLIGLNGSGKSTILQAVDFISRLFTGQVSYWLDQRQWKPVDLNSKFTGRNNINFITEFIRESETLYWKGSFNRTSRRCTQESVVINKDRVLVVNEGQCRFKNKKGGWSIIEITFDYEGSILSLLRDELLNETILSIKNLLKGTASLDLLAPQPLRKKTNWSGGRVRPGRRASVGLSTRVLFRSKDNFGISTQGMLSATFQVFNPFPACRMEGVEHF